MILRFVSCVDMLVETKFLKLEEVDIQTDSVDENIESNFCLQFIVSKLLDF